MIKVVIVVVSKHFSWVLKGRCVRRLVDRFEPGAALRNPSNAAGAAAAASLRTDLQLWFELTKAAHFGMSSVRVNLGGETVVSE